MGKAGAWRAMRAADLPAVRRIAAAVHPGHPEADAVFAERLALWPAGCLVLEVSGAAEGYALAHPWARGRPVPLDTLLGALPAVPEVLYLHDLAIRAGARGGGAGGAAVRRLLAAAGGLPMAIVALGGTAGFWARQGFVAVGGTGGGAPPGYGAGALFMERAPDQPPRR